MTDKDLDAPLRRRAVAGRRPRGGAGDRGRAPGPARPARRPPSCARCPRARAAGCRSGCAARCRVARRDRRLLAVAVASSLLVLNEGVDRTQKRHRRRHASRPPAGDARGLGPARSAHDYDPLGDDGEHARRGARCAVDRDPGTAWTHRELQRRHRGRRQGRRRHLRRRQARASTPTRMEIQTPDARLAGRDLRGAERRRAPEDARRRLDASVGGGTVDAAQQRFTLDTDGKRYRYYLVWITELPPGQRARRDLARSPSAASTARPRRRGRRARARSARARARAAGRSSSGKGTPGGLPQLREDARRREAGHRVELVDQHALALDEEVDPREARAADAQERLDAPAGAPPRPPRRAAAPGTTQLHPARPCTWPRSRTSRRPARTISPGTEASGSPLPITEHSTSMPVARTPRRSPALSCANAPSSAAVELGLAPTPWRSPPTSPAAPA